MSNSDKSRNRTLSKISNLDIWVSRWKRKDVERELHISLSGPVTPSFVLQKINTTEKSIKQKEYIAKVRTYLQYIDIDFCDLFQEEIYTRDEEGMTQLFKDALKEIKIKANKESDSLIRYKILRFLRAVKRLIKQCGESRLHGSTTIYRTTFSRFVSELAELCCLIPECSLANDKESPSVWVHFRGTESAISEPDIRLKKFGIQAGDSNDSDDDKSTWLGAIVSVNEIIVAPVMLKPEVQSDAVDEFIVLNKRKPFASCLSPESTSSDDSVRDPNPPRYKRRKVDSDEPFLPICNGHEVFGRHAGELLFDLNKCYKDTDCEVIRMPGLIVDGVKVIFTLLEMQYEHLKKLRENKELDREDKAMVYYTSPYCILSQRDRGAILNYLMTLNNMVGYGCKDIDSKTEETKETRR